MIVEVLGTSPNPTLPPTHLPSSCYLGIDTIRLFFTFTHLTPTKYMYKKYISNIKGTIEIYL